MDRSRSAYRLGFQRRLNHTKSLGLDLAATNLEGIAWRFWRDAKKQFHPRRVALPWLQSELMLEGSGSLPSWKGMPVMGVSRSVCLAALISLLIGAATTSSGCVTDISSDTAVTAGAGGSAATDASAGSAGTAKAGSGGAAATAGSAGAGAAAGTAGWAGTGAGGAEAGSAGAAATGGAAGEAGSAGTGGSGDCTADDTPCQRLDSRNGICKSGIVAAASMGPMMQSA